MARCCVVSHQTQDALETKLKDAQMEKGMSLQGSQLLALTSSPGFGGSDDGMSDIPDGIASARGR